MPPKYGLQCPQALGTEDVAGKDDDLSAAFGTNSGLVSGSSHLSREGDVAQCLRLGSRTFLFCLRWCVRNLNLPPAVSNCFFSLQPEYSSTAGTFLLLSAHIQHLTPAVGTPFCLMYGLANRPRHKSIVRVDHSQHFSSLYSPNVLTAQSDITPKPLDADMPSIRLSKRWLMLLFSFV